MAGIPEALGELEATLVSLESRVSALESETGGTSVNAKIVAGTPVTIQPGDVHTVAAEAPAGYFCSSAGYSVQGPASTEQHTVAIQSSSTDGVIWAMSVYNEGTRQIDFRVYAVCLPGTLQEQV